MKKMTRLLTVVTAGFLILLPVNQVFALSELPKPANFAGGCLVYPTSTGTINGENIGTQVTRPTKDIITDITIYGEYQAIFEITVYLQKFLDANTVGTAIVQRDFKVTTPSSEMAPYTAVLSGLNLAVEKGADYQITVVAQGTYFWKNVPFDADCDPTGYTTTSNTSGDMAFMFQGFDNPAPSTPVTTTSTTTTTPKTTTTPTAVVAPSVLAVPQNFRLDRDLEIEKIFAWDKNAETDLAGYVMYIYDRETLVETIDIPDKELDNYNVILSEHPLLIKDKEYTFSLVAKTAAAISEKSTKVLATFRDKEPEVKVVVAESKTSWLTNPYVLGGLGLLLVLLIGLLIYLERKFHGLANLLQKIKTLK